MNTTEKLLDVLKAVARHKQVEQDKDLSDDVYSIIHAIEVEHYTLIQVDSPR